MLGSYLPLHIDLWLYSGEGFTSIPAHDYFQSASLEIALGGAWTGSVELFDPQGDYLESLLMSAGLSNRSVRLSISRGPNFPGESVTVDGFVPVYSPSFDPSGVALRMELLPKAPHDAHLDRQIRHFAAGVRISEMVEQIARERGWRTTDSAGRYTIEPTQDPMTEPFTSNGESDFAFVNSTLRPQATSANSVGAFEFRIDLDGTVHFHTAEYYTPPEHTFTYARSSISDVISFSVTDSQYFGITMGGGNAVYQGVSSVNGSTAQVSATADAGVEGQGSPATEDSTAKSDSGSGNQARIAFVTRDPAELARLAQTHYDEYRKFAYRAEMEVVGTARVNAGDYINFRYIKNNATPFGDQEHYLSGRFRVMKVRHDISGDWKTTFELLRSGVDAASGAKPTLVSQPIATIPASAAQGDTQSISVE